MLFRDDITLVSHAAQVDLFHEDTFAKELLMAAIDGHLFAVGATHSPEDFFDLLDDASINYPRQSAIAALGSLYATALCGDEDEAEFPENVPLEEAIDEFTAKYVETISRYLKKGYPLFGAVAFARNSLPPNEVRRDQFETYSTILAERICKHIGSSH